MNEYDGNYVHQYLLLQYVTEQYRFTGHFTQTIGYAPGTQRLLLNIQYLAVRSIRLPARQAFYADNFNL